MSSRIVSVLSGLLCLLAFGGCTPMRQEINPATEKAGIEQVIKNSILWAATKDTQMLYQCFLQDTTLFWFSPDNAGTVDGFASFQKQVEEVFLNSAFRAVRAEFKDLRISLSRGGECAWWSCYLDDFNEWNGRPANWENVRWTGVLEKIDGSWKIVQMHFSHASEDFAQR